MDIVTLKKYLCKTISIVNGKYELIESQNKGKLGSLEKIYIANVPTDSVCFQIDGTRFEKLYNSGGTWHYNKHCDYIIVTNDKIVFIEMKSTNFSDMDCISKFNSDLCTLDYSDSIFVRLCQKNKFFDGKECHFNVLYVNSLNKKSTRLEQYLSKNSSPDSFRRIGSQNNNEILFAHLI